MSEYFLLAAIVTWLCGVWLGWTIRGMIERREAPDTSEEDKP